MVDLISKSFDRLDDVDEVLEYPGARFDRVRIGDAEVWRMIAEPGWRYSESVGPREGSSHCSAEHALWLMSSGRLAVQMADGTTEEFGPGETGSIPPGHDAWVIGHERVVAFDVKLTA